ncbi:hypothetical protein BTJ39_03160 [Izhakiella australiensis]|uniref:OmpR/PhoB-type domain-containing protein n=1 Tax=Izhakiella australiensis TaxID=1926881 RepID=A0A1S8YSV3_9GAMM|nr:transcriptional regulator [Izhakiella australiensis]OON42164.1 hypothetical protein BTJ39_03160 [Izhakiella australiensis]
MDEHCTAEDSDSLIFMLDNDVRFFPARRYITARSGMVINLTENSYRFLMLLLKGETDKQSIINQVWYEQRGAVSDSSYYGQIYSLRKMLDQVGISSSVIKTLPRRGVKYMGKVEMMADDSNIAASSPSSHLSVEPLDNQSNRVAVISESMLKEPSAEKQSAPDPSWINSRHFHVLVTIVAIISVCWLATLLVAIFIFLQLP